ncbi:MAG: DUF421 domain-containing protein [Sphingomonadales bacterium CG12_big_fil_rev_8_21_14_0_65_65_10]|nr:MAG: DUF421 domain-containing protein [Sphingomonadales bacterium CG12_big_fil_rev_8_21_14_0_65_65_10]
MNIFSLSDAGALVATAILTYVTIIALIRVSGKRSTSQMNNFDWVVTVTLGSISASMILLEDVTWAEGALAMATLLLLQAGLTKGVRRFPRLARLVKPRPATLFEKGFWNEAEMREERVTKSEVLSAVRNEGFENLEGITRVILETDASLSVIPDGERQT